MALEAWLTERCDDPDFDLECWLLRLLDRTNNTAVTSVVAGMSNAFPRRAGEAALALLTCRELFGLDRGRVMHESETPSAIADVMPSLGAKRQLFDHERKQADASPHRCADLESLALKLQLGEKQHAVWEILDGHRGALPPVDDQSEPDRMWRLALHRMDIRCYDQELAVLVGHEGSVRDVAFSPDGGILATASDDRSARLWNTQTGAELAALAGHEGPVLRIAFSPAGGMVATASKDGTARLWSTSGGAQQVVLVGHDSSVNAVTFSPDGTRVVTASNDKTARIWDVATGDEIAIFRGHSAPVLSASFSSDGSRVVTASRDRSARVWDAENGKELTAFTGHNNAIFHAVFSPNGHQVVTASRDETARLWDAISGAQLAKLPGHTRPVLHAAFSPDGRKIVTTSGDKIVRVFNVYPTTQALIDHARSVVPRQLTPCERKRFFLPVEGEVGDCPN